MNKEGRTETRSSASASGSGQLQRGSHSELVAVFDTRIAKARRLPGSAAVKAAKLTSHLGYASAGRHSFYVTDTSGPLLPGELERASAWGANSPSRFPTAHTAKTPSELFHPIEQHMKAGGCPVALIRRNGPTRFICPSGDTKRVVDARVVPKSKLFEERCRARTNSPLRRFSVLDRQPARARHSDSPMVFGS